METPGTTVLKISSETRLIPWASQTEKKTLRRLAMNFYLDGEVFYKRSSDKTLLRGLDKVEAKDALREVHEGICSTHASGHDG